MSDENQSQPPQPDRRPTEPFEERGIDAATAVGIAAAVNLGRVYLKGAGKPPTQDQGQTTDK